MWLHVSNAVVSALATQSSSSSAELRRRLLITLLEVLFYYYPSLLTTTLSLFACFHIDPSGPANAEYHNAQVSSHFVSFHFHFFLAVAANLLEVLFCF